VEIKYLFHSSTAVVGMLQSRIRDVSSTLVLSASTSILGSSTSMSTLSPSTTQQYKYEYKYVTLEIQSKVAHIATIGIICLKTV